LLGLEDELYGQIDKMAKSGEIYLSLVEDVTDGCGGISCQRMHLFNFGSIALGSREFTEALMRLDNYAYGFMFNDFRIDPTINDRADSIWNYEPAYGLWKETVIYTNEQRISKIKADISLLSRKTKSA
jgi:hypothetical protein